MATNDSSSQIGSAEFSPEIGSQDASGVGSTIHTQRSQPAKPAREANNRKPRIARAKPLEAKVSAELVGGAAPESTEDDGQQELLPDHTGRSAWREYLEGLSGWLCSMVVHLIILLVLGLWMIPMILRKELPLLEVIQREHEEELISVELDEQVHAATEMTVAVVSSGFADGSEGGVDSPTLDRTVTEQVEASEISVEGPAIINPPAGKLIGEVPKGTLGDPRAVVDGYQEAMDRITQEILWLLSKQDVLVAWCFDQSGSMKNDQQKIRDRIHRVYTELGLSGKVQAGALTTSITSYGANFAVHTRRPTSELEEIRTAIDAVPVDPSGKELMCEAVGRTIALHRDYVVKGRRRMALILVTDECGDRENNNRYLEETIARAKSTGCIIYILGREAVFGYPYAHFLWIHPQTKQPHYLPVDRGPETAFIEQLQTNGFHRRYDAHASGFGPYEQTRMAHQTGGIFFMMPSVEIDIVRGEKRRYELEAMRSYRPDLRARIEVALDRDNSTLRTMLWKVIHDLNPYSPEAAKVIEMRVHFSLNAQEFVRQVRQEQAKAKIYLTYLDRAQKAVEEIKDLRDQDSSPRWQANYDLLYGQLLAYKVRIYEYGAYLDYFLENPKTAAAMKSPEEILHDWEIGTRQQTITGELTASYIKRSSEVFAKVIKDHPSTPWAARANGELKRGFGVELHPHYLPNYSKGTGTEPLIPVPKL